MNREILFRGKHIHALPENKWMEGRWVEGLLAEDDYISDRAYEYMVDPDTVCQYTGLDDAIGHKIWENDIVEIGCYRGVVKYEEGCFVIKWNNNGWIRKDIAYWIKKDYFRVIGNTFDTPELLEADGKIVEVSDEEIMGM